ncbi:MAG: Gfo/Idh/MocA family protein [Thermomicrobiales bacterium]
MAEPVRVGVIGTGIGAAHIEALRRAPDATVVAVCSARQERAQAVARRFRIPRTTTDYHDLLGDGIDAVVVASPPALHLPMARDAIAAGKHVFCEKPLAITLDEARELRDLAHKAGIVHMLNHQQRFMPPYARAKQLLDRGFIGDLTIADARMVFNPVDYLRSPNWSDSKAGWFTDAAQGGGIMSGSAGPHLVDLLLWYGGPIAAVAARTAVTQPAIPLRDGREARDINAADAFVVLARFAHGGMGTIRGIPVGYHQTSGFGLDLHGTAGSLLVEHGGLRGAAAGDDDLADLPLPGDAPQDRVVIARTFIDAVRAGGPSPAPNFDDGVAVQALLAAAETAARTGEWVDVELGSKV